MWTLFLLLIHRSIRMLSPCRVDLFLPNVDLNRWPQLADLGKGACRREESPVSPIPCFGNAVICFLGFAHLQEDPLRPVLRRGDISDVLSTGDRPTQ